MKSPNIESREEISPWERFRSFTNYEDNSTLALPSPSSNEVKFVTSCTLNFFLYTSLYSDVLEKNGNSSETKEK